MKVIDVMVKDVVSADEKESVSKILARMDSHRIHQIPLTKDNEYSGILVLKDLLSKSYEPEKTQAGKFKVSVSPLELDDTLDDAVVKIMRSGYSALPVVSSNSVKGILSMTDLIKHVEYSAEVSVEHFMTNMVTIGKDDNLGKASSLMSENHISRVPVVNSKVIGCIDSFSMVDFLIFPNESVKISYQTTVEKTSMKGFKVGDYMRDTATMDSSDFSLEKAIDLLQEKEEVVITEKGRPVGIVTPKDLLELVMEETTPYVQVSRFDRIDSMLQQRFEEMLINFAKKFSKMFSIQKFYVYVDTHKSSHKLQDREIYSLRARLITSGKVFPAHSSAWDIIDATHQLLEKLEKQMTTKHDKDKRKSKIREKIHVEKESFE